MQPPDDGSPSTVAEADVATALRVLRHALEHDTLRDRLQPALNALTKRQRQRQRLQQRQKAEEAEAAAPAKAPVAPAATSVEGVVQIAAPHLSRPLYPNPVCFLSTWHPGRRGANLMTISWLTPIDNEGVFFCSMNQRRHSAALLAAHPFFVLSVACAGLETLLLRVGGCSGARVADKPTALGVPLCRPGWCVDAGAEVEPVSPLPADEEAADGDGCEDGGGAEGGGWPSEGDLEMPAAPPCGDELDRALAGAVAVAPCVAHIVARVRHVRGAHGHFLLTAETLAAYARAEYWSGKTLERQRSDLPPILSFVGSQRFGRLGAAEPGDDEA